MSEHEHKWQPGGQVEVKRERCSPVSRWSDYLWTDVFMVQMCECGETRRVKIGVKDGRQRRADLRAGRA